MLFFKIKKDCLSYTQDILNELNLQNPVTPADLESNFVEFSFYLSLFLALSACKDISEIRDFILFIQKSKDGEAMGENLWDLFKMNLTEEMPVFPDDLERPSGLSASA